MSYTLVWSRGVRQLTVLTRRTLTVFVPASDGGHLNVPTFPGSDTQPVCWRNHQLQRGA